VDLLIHEATLEDKMEREAAFKRHSTTGQAMLQGDQMRAKRTCLTHFSPRYQKIAEVDERNWDKKVMISFDHMRLKLKHFEHAYKLLKVYKQCFTNDIKDSDFETERKQHMRT
jgi:ribonuclease Z